MPQIFGNSCIYGFAKEDIYTISRPVKFNPDDPLNNTLIHQQKYICIKDILVESISNLKVVSNSWDETPMLGFTSPIHRFYSDTRVGEA